MKTPLHLPFLSSYRLQLHKDFGFQQAQDVVPYLSSLGISHLYLSPIFEAQTGSNHGYDGTNPEKISDERGGEDGFLRLIEEVKKSSLKGMIIDIVPNHLACSLQNPAWKDVLKNGPQSKFAKTFDLKTSNLKKEPVVIPVLGQARAKLIAAGDLEIVKDENEEWQLRVYDHRYPLNKAAQTLLNKKKSGPISAKLLSQILDQQFYSLQEWRTGSRKINYRRFFDINELIGLRMEDEKVFRWFHQKLFSLMQRHPEIQGLRIDHVDGLTFPGAYLKRLRRKTPHIWVEKILGEKEHLPEYWPVLGSTGYEFSNLAARLFVHVPSLLYLHGYYTRDIDDRWELFHKCVYDSKKEILETHFPAELKTITDLFYKQVPAARRKLFSPKQLSRVIAEVTAALRVYRTYAQKGKPLRSPWLEEALSEAEGRYGGNRQALKWFREILQKPGTWTAGQLIAIKRWEQLSGPVMAKGLEDTALYRYCPLLSLNGVGGEPDWIGDGPSEYHAAQQAKRRTFPLGMNTSSTHDTKRSEDVLSRLHVLTELTDEWVKLYEAFLKTVKRPKILEPRTLYMVIETLLGAWPMEGMVTKDFIQRVQQYSIKAAREAKMETSWSDPDEEYEKSLTRFIEEILSPRSEEEKNLFGQFKDFAEKISYYGAFNSLSLLTLKVTSPGVCDFYQGCEMWDLSLVDPDNRRPVDYEIRKKSLAELKTAASASREALIDRLTQNWKSGEIKLFLTWKLLELKNEAKDLFNQGDYLPVPLVGEYRSHFVSYLRHHGDQWLWVIVPRFLSRLEDPGGSLKTLNLARLKTQFTLPAEAPQHWENVLTGTQVDRQRADLEKIFSEFPVAVLRAQMEGKN